MYLINKDETEHTGQVGLDLWLCLPASGAERQTVSHALPLSVLGIICVEDVPRALLGLLSCWRLFQKTV